MSEPTTEMAWDDTISNDDEDIALLPVGEYHFKVTSFERGRHKGSEKLNACPVAKLNIRIFGDEKGDGYVVHRLFLDRKCEGMICTFFRSIGMRTKGQTIIMDWNKVTGATGRCKIGLHTYKDNTYNEIKSFLDTNSNENTPQQDELPGTETIDDKISKMPF